MSSTGRFGARYGATVKKRVEKVEAVQRQKHQCPYCNRYTVKRVATGIFECKKCGKRFTGKAYWP